MIEQAKSLLLKWKSSQIRIVYFVQHVLQSSFFVFFIECMQLLRHIVIKYYLFRALYLSVFLFHNQTVFKLTLNINSIRGFQSALALLFTHYKSSQIFKFARSLKSVPIWSAFFEKAFIVIIWSLQLSLPVIFVIEILSFVLCLFCEFLPSHPLFQALNKSSFVL